jgi:microcompartment protein CcmK/EutM
MQLARVIGTVVVTRKDENLTGMTLLLVQPLTPDRQPSGSRSSPWIAWAPASARTCFVRGKGKTSVLSSRPPVAAIVGIVSHGTLATDDATKRSDALKLV